METIIREYCKDDLKGCMEAFVSNVPKFFTEQEIIDFENFLNRILQAKHTKYYVILDGDTVVGCGGFGDKDAEGILTLAWGLLHQSYHKKGCGKKLLIYRLEQIKLLFPQLQLVVDTTQHSCGFFEKHGFVTTKITNDFYAQGMHRYDMRYLGVWGVEDFIIDSK